MSNQSSVANEKKISNRRTIHLRRGQSGFSLAEMLAVVATFFVVQFIAFIAFWTASFAFSLKVLVPALAVPEAWARLVAFVLSFFVLSIGGTVATFLLVGFVALVIFAVVAITARRRK